jgi:hypothetical protein
MPDARAGMPMMMRARRNAFPVLSKNHQKPCSLTEWIEITRLIFTYLP